MITRAEEKAIVMSLNAPKCGLPTNTGRLAVVWAKLNGVIHGFLVKREKGLPLPR